MADARASHRIIEFLRLFTFAGGPSSTFNTPWQEFPMEYRRAELWVDVKTVHTGGISLSLDTSMDMDGVQAPAGVAASAPGLSLVAVTGDLGRYVRLGLKPRSGGPALLTFSALLIPKED